MRDPMKAFAMRVTPGLRVVWTPRGLRLSQVPVQMEPLPAALMQALPMRSPGGPASRPRRRSQADQVAEAVDQIRRLHCAEVLSVTPPVVPVEATASTADLLPALEKRMLKGISGLARRRRRIARQEATAEAARQAEALHLAAEEQRRLRQDECDRWWSRLDGGDLSAVFSFAVAAFERADLPAALVDVQGRDVTVVALVPGMDAIPSRMPSHNSKGQASTRTGLRGERAELYSTLVAGHAVLTLRQVFALLPFTTTVRLVLLLDRGIGALGLRRFEPLLCVVSSRATFLRSVRPESSARDILRAGCRDILQNVNAGQVEPIPVDQHEGLIDLLHAIDRV